LFQCEFKIGQSAEEKMVMPALLWVAFWSLMMGGTAWLGEAPRPAPAPAARPVKTRDLSSGD
jgi:hypothetical protein